MRNAVVSLSIVTLVAAGLIIHKGRQVAEFQAEAAALRTEVATLENNFEREINRVQGYYDQARAEVNVFDAKALMEFELGDVKYKWCLVLLKNDRRSPQ